MTWKKVVNTDAGDADHFGGNDLDKISDLFSSVSTDDVTFNSNIYFINGKLRQKNPANDASYIITPSAISGDKTLNLPLITATDTLAVLGLAQTFSNKTLDATCNLGSAVGATKRETFLLYNDAGTYKAKNGSTGVISYSGTDVGAVLASICNSVSVTTPLFIDVAPGDYTIKSWGETNFRHSNVTIKGAGSGLTQFIVHNDVFDIAGQDGVFKFEANSTQYTSIALAANATIDSFAVETNAATDLVAGCHVMIGSEALAPSPNTTAKSGEHNRVVKIFATGGSPSQRIILEKATRFTYNTADTAFIRRIDFLENNHFEGFTIKSNQDLTSQITFMKLVFNYDFHGKDLQFKDWGPWNNGGFHHCLAVTTLVNSDLSDLIFEQSPERGHMGNSQNPVGYALSVRSGCETVYFRNMRFKGGIRHCFTTTTNTNSNWGYGEPTNIWIHNANSETTAEASFDTHVEGNGIHFVNCSVNSARSGGGSDSLAGTDDTDAFNSRSRNTRFINCSVMNNRGNGFSCDSTTSGCVFDGCYINGLTLGRIGITPSGSNTVVRNCHITNVDKEGIKVGDSSTGIQISNCVIKNTCRTDNTLSPLTLGTSCTNIAINGIMIDSSNDAAIVPIKTGATGCENISLSNIHLIGAGKDPIFTGGLNIHWDHNTCIGRSLTKPTYKVGRVEGNGGSNSCTGLWEGQTSDVNGTKRVEGTDGTFREYAIATLNTVAGIKSNTYCERDQDPYLRLKFRLETTTNQRFFAGWNSDDAAVGPTGADPLVNKSGFMIILNTATDSNIKIYTNSGDATTTIGATIAAVDTNAHTIEFRGDNTNSQFQYRWDYGTWTSVSTDIPAAGTDLALQFYIDNNDSGVTKTLNAIEMHTEIPQK